MATATFVHSCLGLSESSSRRRCAAGNHADRDRFGLTVFLRLGPHIIHLLLCFPFETPTPTSTTFYYLQAILRPPSLPCAPLACTTTDLYVSTLHHCARWKEDEHASQASATLGLYPTHLAVVHAHQGRARERVPVHCARARPHSAPSALHPLSRAGSESLVSTSNFRVRGPRPRTLFLFYFLLLCALAAEWVSTRSERVGVRGAAAGVGSDKWHRMRSYTCTRRPVDA
ncbi:hypothetical protein C8R44DRAFT_778875 [Mycena epipterygia]|nr:hypothetical protein C8R44DRAFT_778875 [Mycena epipterygia]